MTEKILVIKLSALGDFILALGAMEAIRRKHPDAQITLLTTKLFADIAQKSRYFNDVWIDERPKFFQLDGWFRLFRRFNNAGFSRVYDLQMNDRTAMYHRLFLQKPEWSGTVKGASHACTRTDLYEVHAFKRHQAVLAAAGIEVSYPDTRWMDTDVSFFNLKKPYVLLVPGSAPQHTQKRWQATRYGALAVKLLRDGYDVAVLGTDAERDVVSRIMVAAPDVKDLSGRTSFYDISALARHAAGAVGNDTGPMHIISLTGCPVTVLFSDASNPVLSAPIGDSVTVIQSDDISMISVDDVMKNFKIRDAA